MRVAIVGCGAMGGILGAYLTKNGCPVEMINSPGKTLDSIRKNGVTVVGCADFNVRVNAYCIDDMQGVYDLVLLTTKQTTNSEVLPKLLPHLGKDSMVCAMQNGVPEPFVAEIVGKERTVGCTMIWGSTTISPGVYRLTSELEKRKYLFEVGEMDGKITDRIKKVAEVLGYMGKALISDDLMSTRWTKLVNNACMSGMSAACGCTYGEVFDNPRAKACLSYLAYEVLQCCEATGHHMHELWAGKLELGTEEQFQRSQEAFTNYLGQPSTRPSKASMLQDLEAGKAKTEVDMINGYVCKIGDEYGIDTPYNDALVDIVHRLERKELPLSIENVKYFPDIKY